MPWAKACGIFFDIKPFGGGNVVKAKIKAFLDN